MASPLNDLIDAQLRPLVGLPLSVVRRAADMRMFAFGEMRPRGRGTVGAYVLHVQCSWRLEHDGAIYTGFGDLWQPSSTSGWDREWTYERGNLQDERLAALLGGFDEGTPSIANTGSALLVNEAVGNGAGGAVIDFSGGYRLVIFPDSSAGESWRLLGHQMNDHFVIVGGQLEPADD